MSRSRTCPTTTTSWFRIGGSWLVSQQRKAQAIWICAQAGLARTQLAPTVQPQQRVRLFWVFFFTVFLVPM